MWDDEDNNPYAFERRDSDFAHPGSPDSRFGRPITPPSGTSSPPNEPTHQTRESYDHGNDFDQEEAAREDVPRKRGSYNSRVEQILYEYPDIHIHITHAGKNLEGGGSYIAYTIRTGDFEVRRRYSDFYSLRQTLVNLHPTLIVPPIPEKHSVADYAAKPTKAKEDEAIIDHRKRMLSSFLNRCRRMREIREDDVFWKFLDPHASWSEVLHSPPVSTLPKNNLKAPPLDPANPSVGHSYLPVPSSTAKLKSSKDQGSNGAPPSPPVLPTEPILSDPPSSGPPLFGKFPPPSSQLPEVDLDPYFVNFEASSRELENLLQGNIEKVNRRTMSHLQTYSEDLAELGARFNGFSLSEHSATLAAAIEKMGQAVDSTYIATGDLSASLSAGFSEPMRESAQFAGIVRNVLRYRILKRVQEEITRDELERKRTLLNQLERSEMEARRLDHHLESSGFLPNSPTPRRSASTGSNRHDPPRPDEDSASIDSDFSPGQSDARSTPSVAQGKSEPGSPSVTPRKSSSGSFVANKIFGRINHAIHGMVDVDPERTRRDQIGKTKESLVQLEQALQVSEKDVRDASAGVLRSLKDFQSEKEVDLRRYMIAYAKSHIAWAKKNLTSWEEAKAEVDTIKYCQPHATADGATCVVTCGNTCLFDPKTRLILQYPLPSTFRAARRQLTVKTSYSKKRKYSRDSLRDHINHSIFTADENSLADLASPRSSSPRPSSSTASRSFSPSTPRHIPTYLREEVFEASASRLSPSHSPSPTDSSSFRGFSPQHLSVPSPSNAMTGSDSPHESATYEEGDNTVISHDTPVSNGGFRGGDDVRNLDFRASSPAKRPRIVANGKTVDAQADDRMELDDIENSSVSPRKANMVQTPLPNRTKSINKTRLDQEDSATTMQGEAGELGALLNGNTSSSESHTGSNADTLNASSPPTSTEMDGDRAINIAQAEPPTFDEQVQKIKDLTLGMQLKEGLRGFVVSNTWFNRIVSRTTLGKHKNYPKTLREGEVGPIDNTDLLPNAPYPYVNEIYDLHCNNFLPLKPGLRLDEDFLTIPQEAWDLLVQWHDVRESNHIIVRIAHDTSPDDDVQSNVMFEIYPPIFTIQKLGSRTQDRGLNSIRDTERTAVQIVASRSDTYQGFLRRAKTDAGIDMKTKVGVWKVVETLKASDGRAGIPTPASSRPTSPMPVLKTAIPIPGLVVDPKSFEAMAEGQRELLDIKDETSNEKYNGHLTVGAVGFPETQTLILDEYLKDDPVTGNARKGASMSSPRSSPSKSTQSNSIGVSKINQTANSSRRSPSQGIMTRGRSHKAAKKRGTVGLANLGNTCYMNSALQCIRGVEELTVYFLQDKYKEELNPDNPLGHNGMIAKAYAGLLSAIYDGNSSNFTPRNFKTVLGRCQPLFSGYGQQDSQEFLSFLIDGLHEDLNRIHKKPYIENPDSDDKTVHDPEAIRILGDTFRDNHRKRNDSVAMDLFSGFYKNTMVCPICDKVSVTFDPYAQVTLQLPVENTWQHPVFFAPLHDNPVTVEVDIDKNSSIAQLKDYVAERVPGARAENLVMAEEYGDRFYKVFENAEVISEANIQSADKLWVFELDDSPTNWPPVENKKPKNTLRLGFGMTNSNAAELPSMDSKYADRMAVPIIHRMKSGHGSRPQMSLWPSFILVTREEAKDYELILRKIFQKIETMTTRPLFEDGDLSDDQDTQEPSVPETNDEAPEESKVQARSVEGDEDLVDISMTDSSKDPKPSSEQAGVPNALKMRRRPKSKVLDPAYYIDQDFRNLFDIGIFANKTDIVPGGFNYVPDGTRVPSLESRIPQLQCQSRRPSCSSWTSRGSGRWDRESPHDSEDELSMSRPEINVQSVSDSLHENSAASSEEESAPQERTAHRSLGDRLSRPSKFGKVIREYSRNGKKRLQRSKSRGALDDDYILRLGEGLVLDWSAQGFDQLFGGSDADDPRGQSTNLERPTVPDPELDARRARRADRRKQGVFLDECFSETAKSEVLSEENAWYCSRCKELRRATKTLEIWTVPDILIVHLKRFSAQSRLRDKIDILVDFPVEGLDMRGKVGLPEDKSLTYDLFAVDNHFGGLGGGHYTAAVKSPLDKEWYEYNDSFVNSASAQSVVNKCAYLLFYRRRSDGPLGPPYLQDLVEDAHDDRSRSSSPAGACLESNHDSSREATLAQDTSSAFEGLAAYREQIGQQAKTYSVDAPPAYGSQEMDEGISMDDNFEQVLPGIEDISAQQTDFIGPLRPQGSGWTFNHLDDGTQAPPGSDAGNESDDTLDGAASDQPAVSNGDLDSKLQEDFGDDLETSFPLDGHNASTPEDYTSGAHHIDAVALNQGGHESDEEVAEVRLSPPQSEEGS